jgi:hypothetical protein
MMGYVLDDYCSSWWALEREGVRKGRRLGLSVVCRNALLAFCKKRRRPDWVYYNGRDYGGTKHLFHRDAVALWLDDGGRELIRNYARPDPSRKPKPSRPGYRA